MNGREKSDPTIVATKRSNGAGQPAEEAVERRACPWLEQGAGAERNADQQRTHRTQIRERVTQALDRCLAREYLHLNANSPTPTSKRSPLCLSRDRPK
jgi:hypothetical protein